MALLSWLAGALTGCGDDDPTPAPAGPPISLRAPEPLGPGGTLASALSPDGARVAVGTTWGVGVWDRATLKPLWFERGDQPSRALAFSADGRQLAHLDRAGTIELWSAEGELMSTLEADPERRSLTLGPHSPQITVGDAQGGVQLLSPFEAKPPVLLEGLDSAVNALAWSPDGRTLAACSESGQVARWRGDERVASLREDHSRQCRDLAWAPDSEHLASVGREVVVSTVDSQVASWPPAKGSRMEAVAFSPDGATLLTGMDQGWAQLWDARSGAPGETLSGLYSAPSAVSIGPEVALVQADDATLWDLSGPTRLGVIPSPASAVALALSADGGRLALASRSSVSVLDLETGEVIAAMTGHSHMIKGLSFTKDGRRLVSWSPREAIAWDPTSGAERARLVPPEGKHLEAATLQRGAGRIIGASVQRPTTLTKELRLDAWASADGAPQPPFAVRDESLLAAQELLWSPDEDQLLLRGGASVQIFTADGAPSGSRSALRGSTGSSAWDPLGQTVLSVENEGGLIRWDAQSGEIERRFSGALLPAGPTRVAVSPDGAWIVAAVSTQRGAVVRVWRADGELVHEALPGVEGTLQSLAFHPTRAALAAGLGLPGGEGKLLLWDLHSGGITSTLPSPRSYVTALVWTPSGDALLASMDGGVMRVPAE